MLVNLHNRGALNGSYIVRVPHAENLGLSIGGTPVEVDVMGDNMYIKRALTGSVYEAGYADLVGLPLINPSSVWTTYHDLKTVPAWITTTGTAGATGITISSGQSVSRSSQLVTHIMWGFVIKLSSGSSSNIALGSWNFTLTSGSNNVTYSTGASDNLTSAVPVGTDIQIVIEQRESTKTQETTFIVRLGSEATLTDVCPSSFGETGALSITAGGSGSVTVSGWRQDVCSDINPTLSLVKTRTGSTALNYFYDSDSSGQLYAPPAGSTSNWIFNRGGVDYRLTSYTGVVKRTVLPSGTEDTVLTFPTPEPSALYSGSFWVHGHWGFAEDIRGYLYTLTYSNLRMWHGAPDPLPSPGPMLYRSRDDGITWELVPVAPGVYDRGLGEGVDSRHGHSLYYNPVLDVLFATYGECNMLNNTLKFSNLGDTNRDNIICTPLAKVNRKGSLGTSWDGRTNIFHCPPDNYPVTTLRLNAETGVYTFGPRHRGVYGCLKFNSSPVPTQLGLLHLTDADKMNESPVVAMAYATSTGTTEDVSENPGQQTYSHSSTNASVKDVGDILYMGWDCPPTGFATRYLNNQPSGGTLAHEYWNGTTWVSLSPTGDTNLTGAIITSSAHYSTSVDYSYNITDWARRAPSDFSFSAWVNEPLYWTRIRCTQTYSVAPDSHYWWDRHDSTHSVMRGIYHVQGDVNDTEVEYALDSSSSVGMSLWRPGKKSVVWGAMPLMVDVSEYDLDVYMANKTFTPQITIY
ncbi:hypothetical protein HGB25_00335 [Candidatus Saccharibacteria bacterium]|nr:hypothetical protein [Candidatus Saccharibacteria bacterium]